MRTRAAVRNLLNQFKHEVAPKIIRAHELFLFMRAYPKNPDELRRAEYVLSHYKPAPGVFDDPEVSGVRGTTVSTNFSYPFARSLAERHRGEVSIDWDDFEHPERLAPALARLIPESRDDWAVEAHPDYRAWFEKGSGSLKWLLENMTPEMYDLIELPVQWTPGRASRSTLRIPRRKIFYHDGPFLKREPDMIAKMLAAPPIPRRLVDNPQKIMGVIIDASAVRYRELYGFLYPDLTAIEHADFGRGVDMFLFPPAVPLPVRDYLCGMFFKNGVPMGYIETLTRDGNMEVGFNLYYTFRDGETAWLYAMLLKLCNETAKVTSFVVDPYQLGHENEEAIASGAFWFYRKLGFAPESEEVARLLAKEERKIAERPGYRTPPATLRKLACSRLLYRLL